MSNNFSYFKTNQDYEVLINTLTGDVYIPGYNAMARIASMNLSKPVHKETIRRSVAQCLAENPDLKLQNAVVATEMGSRECVLIPEKIANRLLLKHNPPLAERIYDAGGRLYYHRLAGYEFKPIGGSNESSITSDKVLPGTGSLDGLSQAELLLHAAQCLVSLEKEQQRQSKELEDLKQFREEMTLLQKEAEDDLKSLPSSSKNAKEVTTRFYLNRLVRDYCTANRASYQIAWRVLNMEFRDRYHIDLKARGRNHKPKLSSPEYAEKYNYIEDLYAVADEIFNK